MLHERSDEWSAVRIRLKIWFGRRGRPGKILKVGDCVDAVLRKGGKAS